MRALRALVFGVLLLGLTFVPALAKPDKVSICHYEKDTDTYVYITISEHGLKGHQHHSKDVLTGITEEDCLALNEAA